MTPKFMTAKGAGLASGQSYIKDGKAMSFHRLGQYLPNRIHRKQARQFDFPTVGSYE